jgi:hypothetical protein
MTDQFTSEDEPLVTMAPIEYVAWTAKDAGGIEAKEIETGGGGGGGGGAVDWPPPPHPAISPAPSSRKNGAKMIVASRRMVAASYRLLTVTLR